MQVTVKSQAGADSRRIPVGTVVKSHGLAGEVKVRLQLSDIDVLRSLPILTGEFPDGRIQPLELERVRPHGRGVRLAFKGIRSRSAADDLRGLMLSVERSALLPLADGEYFLGDLVGYAVVTEEGRALGEVQEVWDLPANEVLRVTGADREVLIPLVDEVVGHISHSAKRVVIKFMEGLLD